ncbi:MAG: hypothetical protein F4W90_04625 [Gammaproteobacteria bacterium]|nr:hypothetical protein [Gammaproteobacteria bacterium]
MNGEDLLATLSKRHTARGYLSGHVHQAYDGQYERMKLMTTPSTCWQFKALTTQFAIDELPPGWRWLALQADGSIETKVSRLDAKA